MGTRHLVAVKSEGEYKIAQYGQWDGYPEGQGKSLLDFLKNLKGDFEGFKAKVDALQQISQKELDSLWAECGADPKTGNATMEVSERFNKTYPQLHRDCGAEILQIVYDSKPGLKIDANSLDFAADSLFCEYAYVIDLDQGIYEVFKGFNQTPLTESDRFFFLQNIKALEKNKRKRQKEGWDDYEIYYPVKAIRGWYLNQPLPSLEEFLNELTPKESETEPEPDFETNEKLIDEQLKTS